MIKSKALTYEETQKEFRQRNSFETLSAEDRFWRMVYKNIQPENLTHESCWEIKSSKNRPCLHVNGNDFLAYRVSWVIYFGDIEENILVCHSCDNPKCVNPKHLFIGTQKDNTKDAFSKGRIHNYTYGEGENSNKHKLKNNDVIKIRKLYKTGKYNQMEIGKMFNVSNSTISKIVTNQYWKHLL